MDIGYVKPGKNRGFFGFYAPLEAFGELVGLLPHGRGASRTVILDLQSRNPGVRSLRVDGARAHVIPFPHAHRALVRILTDPGQEGLDQSMEVLLPRRVFDQLADRHGASRIKRLDLEAGIAVDDTIVHHLGTCLEHVLEAATPAIATVVDHITASVTVHVAQRYGGLEPERLSERGGLAAWQLRLVWAAFNRHLAGSVPLDDLARECGLSVSHFSRAFRRSTGLAPHRWLMHRRVEVAKNLMLAESMPLAEVAVACGFADQSHFTRTFGSLIGRPPARWRTDQEREFAQTDG